MSQTISKHIGEGFGKGELYAALAYDATDVFGGMKIKALMLNSDGRISFLDANSYIYSSSSGVLDIVATTVNVSGILAYSGDLTLTGNLILANSRVASGAIAGTSIALGASYEYGEAIELRYNVTAWTGIGSSFKALYLRSEADLGGSYGLRCAEFYGVMDTASTLGLSSLQVTYSEMLIKASASNRTLTNGHCVEANISIENQTGTLTLTNDIYCLYAKAQTGTGVNDYTKVNGIKIGGRDDGTARVFGIALDISDPEATVCTWTTGIKITTSTATAINIEGTHALALGIGSTTALTTATSETSAVKVQSNYSKTDGYHVGAWFSSTETAAGASTGTVYALRGHAATSGVKTNVATAHYVIGTHGRVALGGTINADNLIAAGICGQVLAAGTLTKLSQIAAVWADSQLAQTISTGEFSLFYGSNNGSTQCDQMIKLYGKSDYGLFVGGKGSGETWYEANDTTAGAEHGWIRVNVHDGTARRIKLYAEA